MNIRLLTAALVCSLLVGACTTAAPGVDEARFARKTLELPGKGADCVFGSVRDYTVLDDHALILYTSARSRAYYVEVAGVCHGLRTAFQLGFEDRDERLCGFGMDAIIIPDGSFTERCPIGRIHKLEDGDINMVLEHYGRARVKKKSPESAAQEDTGT